jgi:hypothetical protein
MSFFHMTMSHKIIDLRNLLAKRFPHAPRQAATRLLTGVASFDRSMGGGLPKSAITELISPRRSAGSASLIHALIQRTCGDKYFVALIDGRDSFDPCALGNSILRQMLWVRCATALEAVQAADLILRDGNFFLAIVDLVLNPWEELRKIPQTTWYRLQRLVESVSTACLVLTRHEMISGAQLKLVLENSWNLHTLEDENTIAQLRFRVRRSHLRSVVNSQWSAVD